MKFTEFTENNKHILSEEPALAYSPSEFTARYGMSPAQAEVVVDNVVKLNPGYSSPAVKDSIRKYLLTNPEALQSANDNVKPPSPKGPKLKINPGSLFRGIAGKALGVIGMIMDPSELGDGTITPEIQLQWDIEKHLQETDPTAYIQYLDTQWESLSDEQKQDTANYPDPKTTEKYKDALNAIETDSSTDLVRPEGPAAGMPATKPSTQPVRKPDTPPSRTPADPRRTRPTPKPAEPGVEPDTKPPAPTPKPAEPGVEPDTKPPAPKPLPMLPDPEVPTLPKPKPETNPQPKPETKPETKPDTKPETKPQPKPRPKPKPEQGPKEPKNPKKRNWPDFGLKTPNLERIPPRLIQLSDPLNLKRNA